MIVDHNKDIGYRSYQHNPIIKIASFSDLPPLIQFNTNGYLKRILGKMSDSLHFTQGQEIDLKAIFQKDSVVYTSNAIKPKYILKFVLVDNSIGIKSYNLSLELDEHGQLLFINWPKDRANDKSKIIPRDSIKEFVLNYAKSKRFNTSNYEVYFNYYKNIDKLCWQFKFPNTVLNMNTYRKRKKTYNIVVVPWNELKIIQEFKNTKVSYPHAIK